MSASFYRSLPLQFMGKKKKKSYFIAEMFDKITGCEIVFQNTCRMKTTLQNPAVSAPKYRQKYNKNSISTK